MADNNDVIQRALAKVRADAAPQPPVADTTVVPMFNPEQQMAEPLPIQQLMQSEPELQMSQQPVPEVVQQPQITQAIPIGIAAPELMPVPVAPGQTNYALPQPVAAPSGAEPDLQQMQQAVQTAKAQQVALNPMQQQAVAEVASEVAKPSNTQIVKEIETQAEPLLKERTAKQAGAVIAQQQAQQAKDDKDIANEAAAKLAAIDNEVKGGPLAEIMQKGNFGQKMGAAIAVMMSSIGSALQGKGGVPVLEYLDKQFENELRKSKLSQDKADSARQQYAKEVAIKLEAEAARQKNDLARQQLQMAANEYNLKYGDVQAKRLEQAGADTQKAKMYAGAPVTPELKAGLTDFQLNSLVAIPRPGGVIEEYMATNPAAAKEVLTYSSDIDGARQSLKRLIELSKELPSAWTPLTELSPEAYMKRQQILGEMDQHRKAVSGALRLPYLGPGVMDKSEYERLDAIIGDPSKSFTLRSLEESKLKSLDKTLEAKLQWKMRRSGIRAKIGNDIYRNIGGRAVSETDAIKELVQKSAARKQPISLDEATRIIQSQPEVGD